MRDGAAPVDRPMSRLDRALTFGAIGVFAIAPVAPDWPRLITERPTPIFPVFCAIAMALAAGIALPPARRRWWMWLAATPYISVCAVYLLTLFVFVEEASAWTLPMVAAWPVAVGLLACAGKNRAACVSHMAWVIVGTVLIVRHTHGSSAAMVLAAMVYLAFMAFVAARVPVVKAIGWGFWAAHAFTALVYIGAYLFHQGVDPAAAERVLAQPGVRPVVVFNNRDRLARRVGDDIMIAIPTANGVILGPHEPEKYLRRVRPDASGKAEVESIFLGTRTGDNSVQNPAIPDHWFIGAPDRVIEIQEEPFDLVRTYEVPGGLVNFLRNAGSEGGLILSRDNGRSVVRLDLRSGALTESAQQGAFRRIFDVAFDDETDRFVAVCVDWAGTALIVGSADSMAVEREVRVPESFGYLGDIDVTGRRFYLASFHTGEVIAFDLDTMEIRDRIFVGGTPRNATFDASRQRLYVSDYFGGRIIVLNPETRTVVAVIDVGSRPRQTILSPDGRILAFRGAAGVFTIDLDDALGVQSPATPSQSTFSRLWTNVRVFAIRFLMPVFVAMRSGGS